MTPLASWQNFYVIVGSSAGALTGLQFVVMALVANRPVSRGLAEANDAFATPTIVHFGAVLLLSGVLSAPWRGMTGPLVLCRLCGLIGFVYVIRVARRLQRQSAYEAVFEDWFCHVLLPLVAYGVLLAASYVARSHPEPALFGVGASAFLLLFIGIHNAWDSVTYLVFVHRKDQQDDREPRRSGGMTE